MASQTKPLALLVLGHPTSPSTRSKVVTLHNSLSPLFRNSSTKCTTRTMFTPATRPKASLGMVPASEKETLLGLIEIFSSADAFAAVQKTAEYKAWHETVEKENLVTGFDVSEWTPAAGFVARTGEKETAKAGIVMLAKFVVKENDVQGNREGLVGVLGKFCDWVNENEAGTLTYCVMTSPSSPTEVLMFERYKDLAALGVHGKSAEFKAMFKGTGRFIQGKKTVLSEWEEVEGSFVSNTPGGAAMGGQAKL